MGKVRAPHWPEKYANSPFLVLLRLIFAPKMKTAPPQRDLGAEVVKDLPLFGPEKRSFLIWSTSKLGEDLFFSFFFLEIT